MEVTTNNTVKEPQQEEQQKQSVSGFCEYLDEVLSNMEVKLMIMIAH